MKDKCCSYFVITDKNVEICFQFFLFTEVVGFFFFIVPSSLAFLGRYEQQVREQQSQLEKEDFSDMVAEHAAKQKVSLPISLCLYVN